jgi:tRNA(adenine34) deaminase
MNMQENQAPSIDFDEKYMAEALKEAIRAGREDEVPVGCVVVHDGKIIGRGHNRTIALQDPTAHAEILAVTAASEHLGSWRLSGCTVYSTIEPCIMCAGALVLARVERLVYGAPDPKFGACESLYNIVQDSRLNHRLSVSGGISKEQCADIMQEFFRKKRSNAS